MSFETTEVSPNNNNNKENSEIFDDPMVCDDDTFIDNNGMRKGENNESITVEVLPAAVTDEIPSKYDTCTEVRSTFGSPKSKKRKLLRSDEWLENLQLNFTKLLLFLESDNKELAFPFVVKEYEEFFEMIVQDINILQSKSSYADYRDICDKIIVAATGYVLTCVYEYRQDFQKIVMVIKKEHKNMMDQSENGTSSFFCATESIMPSSQISSEVDSTEVLSRSPTPGPISSGFKLQCLRTTLAFIKNDITNTEEFPELNFEQAHFMQLLLESVIAFTEFDSNLEMKDLYRALWEAVRIYRLKYEFRVKCEESSDGKKNLLFEKVPKNKPPVTAVNSNQTMEVIYIKERKHVPVGPVVEPAQSAPKKKKINIQNAIQLAETDNMKLETVIDLNKSLRNKKKNKKREKSKLKAASKEATAKSLNQAKSWTDGSSSNCSSRGTSRDRYKKVAQAQNVAKRPMNEINQSAKKIFQETLLSRRGEETIRKEQLKEALSVPVQSDKAMKMMRGMGWSGGALGARGNGITEPLKPTLDLARGAGFGHSRNGQSKTFAKKPRESKKAPAFVSQNSSASSETDNMETDVIVQKTNQLLLENPTLDKILKAIESNVELPKSTKTTVELPKPIKANVEPPKPTTSIPKQQLQSLITPTESSNELLKPGNSNLEYRLSFREEILYTILELLTSDATSKTLTYKNKICKKKRRFVGNVRTIKTRNNFGIFQKEEHDIYREILDKYKKCPEVIFETLYSYDFKTVQITKKVLTEVQTPQQQLPSFSQLALKANSEKKTEENIHSYITSSGTNYETEGADEVLKFKVLFLSNILSFVKSFNEEIEVTFDKVLNRKQQTYIQNVVDEVNMRIKFGSSPAETKLCAEIGNHVKDAFLAYMFDHQYKVVTLSKYFRRKRFKRPDDAVKGTCQTTVNLDAVSSDTFSASKLNTNEPPVKENNNNCTVLKLTPDEEGINISNFLHLYDKEKTNTAGIENHSNVNKDSASKKNLNVTEHSNKNNIGNGNIVIDNDDSQVIDMKRDCDNTKNNEKENNIVDTEMVKYVVCVDCSEEAVDSREMTVDINKEKEEILTDIKKDGEEIDQTMKHSDIVVANDVVEMVNQHKDIGIDKINKMIGEVLSNTEDTIDQNEIVIEDSDSNDCTETIVNDEIQNCDNSSTNNKDINEDTDVIMKEIDDEPMEGISITENSKEVIDKEDSVKEINIEESMGLINQVKYMEEINKIESSKGKEISKMEKENSINPSDEQIVKGDLEIKIDCDIISKEKLVLSEGLCDTHSVGLSHVKTVGTETDIHISKDTDIKTVRIVHANHPIEELTNENIKEIQRHISNRIFLATQLPLLKCHGVQNGALIYSCHNKNTYDWLQNAISVASYVKVLNTKEITKMALKLYCFFDFDTKDLFRMIESYNQELSTKDWVVENTEKDGDCITFILRMDKFSIKFIQESDLALFAGIDKIQFSPVWE